MVYSGVGHAPPRNTASLLATGLIVMVEFAHFNRDEEEYPMTDASLLIEELAAKSGDGDFLRAIAESVMQLIMEADVDGLIGAGRHERSGERATWRNGYRDRSLDTRVGTLNLKIPKLRTGTYFPGFLEPRKMVEKALVNSGIGAALIPEAATQLHFDGIVLRRMITEPSQPVEMVVSWRRDNGNPILELFRQEILPGFAH